jgi:acetate kinase
MTADPRILTINGGSSRIKFALFEAGDPLRRMLGCGMERIGLPEEILLTEAFHRRFPDLPRVARWLPIPRRYEADEPHK